MCCLGLLSFQKCEDVLLFIWFMRRLMLMLWEYPSRPGHSFARREGFSSPGSKNVKNMPYMSCPCHTKRFIIIIVIIYIRYIFKGVLEVNQSTKFFHQLLPRFLQAFPPLQNPTKAFPRGFESFAQKGLPAFLR